MQEGDRRFRGRVDLVGRLVLLRTAERRLGLAETLANCVRERRDPKRVVHTLVAMLRFRMLTIVRAYGDADACDGLHTDPLFMLAVGRARPVFPAVHGRAAWRDTAGGEPGRGCA